MEFFEGVSLECDSPLRFPGPSRRRRKLGLPGSAAAGRVGPWAAVERAGPSVDDEGGRGRTGPES
jgi:hypothetical protein